MAPDETRETDARPSPALLSIVVPVYNEEACVEEMVRRLEAVLSELHAEYEIIFVNDGSKDGTLAALRAVSKKDERIRYISFSRNFGHQFALSAGIDHARGDAVVSLDGDLQHPPEMIPQMVEQWRNGYDVVYTVRAENRGHAIKEFWSRGFYWLMRVLTGVQVPTGGADFRLLDKRVADVLRECREQYVFVRGLVPWLGFKRKALAYNAAERFGGATNYSVRRMLGFALDGVFSFSIVPLRMISFLGAVTIALGFVYGLYSVSVRLFSNQAVSGWTSLVVVVLVFSGTQLLSLGILSEYVGRIYEEVKQRPRYIIESKSAALESQVGRHD
jgi:dolichol-phosphate mannosyltransferase